MKFVVELRIRRTDVFRVLGQRQFLATAPAIVHQVRRDSKQVGARLLLVHFVPSRAQQATICFLQNIFGEIRLPSHGQKVTKQDP